MGKKKKKKKPRVEQRTLYIILYIVYNDVLYCSGRALRRAFLFVNVGWSGTCKGPRSRTIVTTGEEQYLLRIVRVLVVVVFDPFERYDFHPRRIILLS